MDAAPYQLPPEFRIALESQGGQPLRIWDEQSQKLYLLIEEDSFPAMDDEYLRQLIKEADEDVAAGDVELWDVEETKREGRRILAERRAQRGQ